MYSTADCAVTPRPMYPADGRKVLDVYTQPAELRDELQRELGAFPVVQLLGARGRHRVDASWIADARECIEQKHSPTLTLVYLPHLDYNLQRFGPPITRSRRRRARRSTTICGGLIALLRGARRRVIVLSEYGITRVASPVHINRVLREAGLLTVREELGRELLDAGASEAFAVADHQVAHVYVQRSARRSPTVRDAARSASPGVERVLDARGKRAHRHSITRARGDLVAIAAAELVHLLLLAGRRARAGLRAHGRYPSQAGYDPVELFLDPALACRRCRGPKLARKQLGFRKLLDVIPLDATLVKGSHGRRPADEDDDAPVFITRCVELTLSGTIESVDVHGLILRHLRAGDAV